MGFSSQCRGTFSLGCCRRSSASMANGLTCASPESRERVWCREGTRDAFCSRGGVRVKP
ncbi:hypothetical protein BDV97DRAFT_346409 [Delphinella strobiligena]|nr:hypothetical protein BDV97DRAFT_346409 [Delphinella strobiligena]